MKSHLLLLLFTIISFEAFGQTPLEKYNNANEINSPGEVLQISILQLISTPEKFDGKVISVTGFLKLEFEGTALYFHKEDYKNHIYKNSVWLNISGSNLYELKKECDEKYAAVIGTFKANQNGHFGIFNGTIANIRAIYPKNLK